MSEAVPSPHQMVVNPAFVRDSLFTVADVFPLVAESAPAEPAGPRLVPFGMRFTQPPKPLRRRVPGP